MEADSTEHSAWDCSSVPSRVAHLLSYWMKHLDSGGKADECLVALCSLVKVPAVACMLPAPLTDETKKALEKISDAGIELLAAAETALWDMPRMLFVFRLREAELASPVSQLQHLLEEVAEATVLFKPSVGPWLWPLHEPDVSAALLVCDAMADDEHWAMRIIRGFRILPPVHMAEQQKHIREQYSASTTYVFAWSEIYVQGIWALLIVAIPVSLALSSRPWVLGWESWQFYLLQVIMLLWTMVMAALSRSRRAFVNDGSLGAKSERPTDLKHLAKTRRAKLKQMLAVTGAGNAFAEVVNLRQNPDHWHQEHPKTWTVLSIFVTVLASSLCLTMALFFLLIVMELKMLLIFNWGECFERGCIGPEEVHGFAGFLSMVGTDILLALLINVATGELCKAFAFQIAKFWNFKDMRHRLFCFHMTGALIDGLAAIGVFSFLAFAFLPEWEKTIEASWDDASMCQHFFDYQICRAMAGCSVTDQVCCSGTLFCARAKAPVTQRQNLFNAWLGGLFMVAPFVDVLMQFVVPLLTYWFHLKADRILEDDERLKKRSCCCGCLSGLGRLLAFIFVLDGGVMGLPYVWRGYPFKDPKIEVEADDDYGRKALGPVCANCKKDMHWTKSQEQWECRHSQKCNSTHHSKGETRWRCNTCEQSICSDCHPLSGASLNHLFGPLDQRLLRPFNPIDELKMLKMNFMIVIMFAPINPLGLIAQLLARLLDIHSRLSKLLIVRRRDSPMDNALAHISQQVFGHIILPFAAIWHIGLALISYNTDLWDYDHSLIVIIWFTAAGAITALFLLLQFLAFKLGYYAWGKHQARRTMSSLASTASLGSSLDPGDFAEKDLEDLKHELEADANLAAPKERDGTDPVTEMEMISHPGKVPEVTGELVHQDPAGKASHETAETHGNLSTPTNGAWCCGCQQQAS
ncbi:unnamed protein product [Cladocopium goreaui]|uniref:Uncharacterized protein n=1 Tax=Cladocopium goreaui TaxID=2562237 RepID=A0A9P1C0I6_9DINO|nr:unnamed protein product [Cladocopium goreaui]